MTSVKASAKEILDSLQYLFDGPDELVPAFEDEFPHINFSKYKNVEEVLLRAKYKKICDLEVKTISDDPTGLLQKTLIRSFISNDGEIVVAFYELRPKLVRLLQMLARGLLALRWIDAPSVFVSAIPARFIIDFETELSDGQFIITSNASAVGLLKGPTTIDNLIFPYQTELEELSTAHISRVKDSKEKGKQPRIIENKQDLIDMQKRLKLEKSAHRSSCDWITYDEIEALCFGKADLAQSVYKEIRELIDIQKSNV